MGQDIKEFAAIAALSSNKTFKQQIAILNVFRTSLSVYLVMLNWLGFFGLKCHYVQNY